MRSLCRFACLLIILVMPLLAATAQPSISLWTVLEKGTEIPGEKRIQPEAFQLFSVDFEQLKAELLLAPEERFDKRVPGLRFPLPMPDGSIEEVEIFLTWVLSEQDKDDYPNIRTFVGHGKDDPYAYVRLDITPHGFHGMILTHGDSYWIDPYVQGNTGVYMAYRKSDARPRPGEDYTCEALDPGLDLSLELPAQRGPELPVGTELLVYDLAVTCAGEYGAFHGGTKALAQAAIVTSINRVTGIYERDMSIRLALVPNNDTLVFADPTSDPYPCCNLGTALGVGANLIDSLIGAANYDIGHTYCTYGGGGAANGVCESDKADGATGLSNPVGDPFDVDYVAHEMGHQFYAGHTFNYCPGPGHIPHEPGSGSTILAYAGLCGTANMQNFSVDAFSVGSYEQSVSYTRTGFGNSCPTVISMSNQAPSISLPAGGFYIPRSTPFELTATGSDLDGDSLTYSWEQWDFGPNVHPDSSVGDCPLFRVLWPTPDSTRIFPQISDIVQGTQTIGEQLPTYGRTMTFRCAIRDNRGGADYGEMEFFVADSAGPFELTYPSASVGFWTVGAVENIIWDVANTDVFPVNCASVDLYLSTDGGYTYPILLAAGRPNTGATTITVPNILGNNMRIKIKGAGNHFFDISDSDFAILPAGFADYSMTVDDPVAAICGFDTTIYMIELDTIGQFTDSISFNLAGNPAGTGYAFSENPASTPGMVMLQVWNDTAVPADVSLILQANSSSGVKNMPLSLRLRSGVIPAVSPISPFNGSSNAPTSPILTWNAVPFAHSYWLQVSTSPAFDSLIVDATGLNTTAYPLGDPLSNNTVYYWRVQVDVSDCGSGDWGDIYSFQTPIINCATYSSVDVPVIIPETDVDTVYSTLNVPSTVFITDVNVLELEGTHTWMDDLAFTLISPLNTRVFLFGNQCGDQDDFWLSFDDTASIADIPCPPTTGLVYQPATSLLNFNAEDAQGDWTLEIIDRYAADGGQLNQWALEICGPAAIAGPPTLLNQLLSVDQGATDTISSAYLQGNCSDSSTSVFTLVSLPQYGALLLNSQVLQVGDTFTQAEINAGLLTYQHDSLLSAADQFQFTLACSDGAYVGGLSFLIEINTPSVGLGLREDVQLSLYPNPAQDACRLKVEGLPPAEMEIVMFDLMGQRVYQQTIVGQETQLPLHGLSTGIYTILVRRNGEWLGVLKLMIES